MKNIFVNRIKLFAAAFSLLLICSCSDDFSGTVQDKNYPSKDGKTYLCLSAALSPEARSIAPKDSDYDVTQLTNLVLTGKLNGGSGEDITLASASNYTAINGKNIPVSGAGSWTFTLTADFKGVPFTGTLEQEITEGSVNTLTFTLGTEQTQGGMSITFKFKGSSTKASDYKVNAVLMTQDKEEIETKTFENTEDDTSAIKAYSNSSTNTTFSVVYSHSVSDTESSLQAGTYYLVFEVFDTRTKDEVPLNTSRNFVRVDKGITTTAELSLTLNEVYSITYNYNEGEEPAAGAVMTLNYSRKSAEIILPQMVKDGYEFEGWYENADFSGDPVRELPLGTTGDLTFWARFIETDEPEDNTFYVSSEGSETNDGLTRDTALDSVAAAVAKIKEADNKDADWTIKIAGTLTGAQVIADISEDYAASLTICGTGVNDDYGVPEDEIKSDNEEPALKISCTLPVTVRDIKITKGTGTSDKPAHGVYVGDGSRIYLAGTPVIDDLYVQYSYEAIYLTENLTGAASVTLTPDYYETPYIYETEICKNKYIYVNEDNNVDISSNYEYFHITPEVDENGSETETEWFIDKEGCLNRYCIVSFIGEGTYNWPNLDVPCSYFEEDDLNVPEREGYLFKGWYFNKTVEHYNPANFSYTYTYEMQPLDYKGPAYEDEYGDMVEDYEYTFINSDITLYAAWISENDNIYVDASHGVDFASVNEETGDSTSISLGDGSEDAPFKTIICAVDAIKTLNDPSIDYTILITGFTDDINITIDENVPANSVTLKGAVEPDNNGEPVCGIKQTAQYTLLTKPSILRVSGGVHVTITNFKFDVAIYGYEGDGALINVGNGGKVTLENGTLLKGTGSVASGGYPPEGVIAVEDGGNLFMKSGSVIDNYYIKNGAVYVKEGGIFTMEGGTISAIKGGGVYLQASGSKTASFTMTGGTISQNTEGFAGNGIGFLGSPDDGITGIINLGDSAVIDSSNNIYLPSYMTINISSELTAITDSNKPVITPEDYSEGIQILEATDTGLLNDAAQKFAVTPQTDGDGNQITWTISDDGKLVKQE